MRTDVAGRLEQLVDADESIEIITSVVPELGVVLDDEHEVDGELVITASVRASFTAQQIASALTVTTHVTFHD